MRVGGEFVRRVGQIALRKQCKAMRGFVDVLDDLIARLRGELFQLMDRPVGLFRLPGRSIHTRPLAPDQAEQSVAVSFRDSFECAGVLQGGLKGIELNELNIWIRSKQGLPA